MVKDLNDFRITVHSPCCQRWMATLYVVDGVVELPPPPDPEDPFFDSQSEMGLIENVQYLCKACGEVYLVDRAWLYMNSQDQFDKGYSKLTVQRRFADGSLNAGRHLGMPDHLRMRPSELARYLTSRPMKARKAAWHVGDRR